MAVLDSPSFALCMIYLSKLFSFFYFHNFQVRMYYHESHEVKSYLNQRGNMLAGLNLT